MEGHMASDVNANRRRDFIGYGRQRPKVTWPNKAELAVSFVVNLEEGAEASLEDGQPSNDKLGEFVSSLPDGMRDLAMEQFHEYALRAGIWRILDLFDRCNSKATFYMCGRAVERTPESALLASIRCGHRASIRAESSRNWVSSTTRMNIPTICRITISRHLAAPC